MRVYILNILSKDLKGKGIFFHTSADTALPFMCEKTKELKDTTINHRKGLELQVQPPCDSTRKQA